MNNNNELLIANSSGNITGSALQMEAERASARLYRKEKPPKIGEKFDPDWATGRNNVISRQLPGGGLLTFDLDRLTLQDYRAMRNHYQINISLSLLAFMLHQVPWRIEGGDEKVREFLEENLKEIWTRLVRAVSVSYWSGYSPCVLQFENEVGSRRIKLTKIKDIEPERATINWKEIPGYAPPGHPKPKIKIYDGIKLKGQNFPVPVENTFWYPLLMESGNPHGRKLLKPAFPSWFFSQVMHLYVNRYFERFGEPIPVGRAPFDDELPDGKGGTVTGKAAMENTLNALRNRSAVVLPSSVDPGIVGSGGRPEFEYQIEYVESQMRGADFERYLARLDEEMSLGIFTPVLLYRTADVGSYNLGEAHERIFLIMTNSLIGDLAEYVNKYILHRLIDINFGRRARKDIRFVPHRLGEQVQATLRQMVAALIQAEIAMPDLYELGLALGISMEEIETLTEDEKEIDETATGGSSPAGGPGGSSGANSSDSGNSGSGGGPPGGGAPMGPTSKQGTEKTSSKTSRKRIPQK